LNGQITLVSRIWESDVVRSLSLSPGGEARGEDGSLFYCAIGKIDYSGVDKPVNGKLEPGVLIYLKPALCGKEPKDVFNYTKQSKDFPHESTANQFFSESQFESYRALGLHIVNRIYLNAKGGKGGVEDFVEAVHEYLRHHN
jgi:hypothetical protein